MPWKLKTSWVKSLYLQAFKLCSSKCLLKNQIELIEQFMLWSNFPEFICNSLLKNLYKEAPKQEKNIVNKNNITQFGSDHHILGVKVNIY